MFFALGIVFAAESVSPFELCVTQSSEDLIPGDSAVFFAVIPGTVSTAVLYRAELAGERINTKNDCLMMVKVGNLLSAEVLSLRGA